MVTVLLLQEYYVWINLAAAISLETNSWCLMCGSATFDRNNYGTWNVILPLSISFSLASLKNIISLHPSRKDNNCCTKCSIYVLWKFPCLQVLSADWCRSGLCDSSLAELSALTRKAAATLENVSIFASASLLVMCTASSLSSRAIFHGLRITWSKVCGLLKKHCKFPMLP